MKLKSDYLDHLLKSKILHWDEKNKTMFSHASLTKEAMRTAVSGLNAVGHKIPNYSQLSGKDLPGFVNALNRSYREFIAEMVATPPKTRGLNLMFKEQLFANLVDNRSQLEDPSLLPFNAKQHGVKFFVHGHDSSSKKSPLEVTNPKHNKEAVTTVMNQDNRVRQGSLITGSSTVVSFKES